MMWRHHTQSLVTGYHKRHPLISDEEEEIAVVLWAELRDEARKLVSTLQFYLSATSHLHRIGYEVLAREMCLIVTDGRQHRRNYRKKISDLRWPATNVARPRVLYLQRHHVANQTKLLLR